MTTVDRAIRFLTIYICLRIVWLIFIWTGSCYLVFFLHHSPWWLLLTCALSLGTSGSGARKALEEGLN